MFSSRIARCRKIFTKLKFYFFLFFFFNFCHTQWKTSIIKTIINRLINIEFKICRLLGRSDCGGEISEKSSLQSYEKTLQNSVWTEHDPPRVFKPAQAAVNFRPRHCKAFSQYFWTTERFSNSHSLKGFQLSFFSCSFSCSPKSRSSGMTIFAWILRMATQAPRSSYTTATNWAETKSGNMRG